MFYGREHELTTMNIKRAERDIPFQLVLQFYTIALERADIESAPMEIACSQGDCQRLPHPPMQIICGRCIENSNQSNFWLNLEFGLANN